MQSPREKVISVSQAFFLSERIKKAASLILKKDSSGSNDTEAVRILLEVCDALENVNQSTSGSSTDKNFSAASGNSQ